MIHRLPTQEKDSAIEVPTSALTLAGFREWATGDDYPYSRKISFLTDRLWIDMSPEELHSHNWAKMAISRTLDELTSDRKRGAYCPDGVLISHEEAGLSTEPDGMFFTWESVRSGRLQVVPRKDHPDESVEFVGTPDIVLELISRSSGHEDRHLLRDAYYRAGIPEYWLVDAVGDEIEFAIFRAGPEQYDPAHRDADWHRSDVFEHWFRLTRERTEMDFWSYRLESKAT